MIFLKPTEEGNINYLLNHEEKHKGSIISLNELFNLLELRYKEVLNIVEPVREYLSKYILINNVLLQKSISGNLSLIIELIDDKKELIFIEQESIDEFDIILDTSSGKYTKFINLCRKSILDIFNEVSDEDICNHFELMSSSNLFEIDSATNELNVNLKRIKDSKLILDYFKMSYLFGNDNDINKFDIKTSYQGLEDKLRDLEYLKKLLLNIKILEKDVPKVLLKNK